MWGQTVVQVKEITNWPVADGFSLPGGAGTRPADPRASQPDGGAGIIAGIVELLITAAAGFLIAVLWFDLMFDVQVLRHRADPLVPEAVLESIAAYYRRVTTTASPMGRLVAVAMAALFVGLSVQAVRGDAAWWVSAVSFPAALLAVGLAMGRVFGRAVRLGTRADPADVQSDLARSICRDHLICLASMSLVLAVQLAGG